MRRTLRGAEVYKFHQLNHGGRVMSIKPQLSRAVRAVSATALLGMACCPSTYAVGERSNIGAAPRYLFICAGDQARQAPDFLAVVNFNEHSEGYGKIIATAPFPATNATGNEPHHIGLSDDGEIVACGGLLSVLKGQKEIFFFNVANPRSPRFVSAGDPPFSSITDDFQALPGGGFLVTMMGGPAGHAPGRVAEFDRALHLVHEYPDEPPTDGFNPHGISLRPEINLMVTSDFICPATTLHGAPGNPDFRGSIRVWNLQTREIVRTITTPGAGTIDVKLIPHDSQRRGFTAAMLDDHLYLLDTQRGVAEPVFDFSTTAASGWPQPVRITEDGRRLFVSRTHACQVLMLDISQPGPPRPAATLDL